MENLQELIKSLKKSEKKMVRKFLSTYSSNGKSETLGLDLFDLLNKRKKVLSNKDCSLILFKKDEKNRIRVLKSRLKQRVLDALTTDIVLESQSYDVNVKLSIQLTKKLQQSQMLWHSNKGNHKTLINLLDTIIVKAAEYEQFTTLTEALRLKKLIVGFRAGMDEFLIYDKQITEAKQKDESKLFIVDSYYKMILLYRTSNPNHSIIQHTLKEFIEQSENLLFKGNTIIGQYYLNIIKTGYYFEIKEHDSAIHAMKNQLTLLNTSKVVYRKNRVGATYDYLSEGYINMGEYKKAAENAGKALEYFNVSSTNYIVAQQLLFRAKLYGSNIKEAETLIAEIIKYDDALDKHRISVHRFFRANLYFTKKEYKKCNRLLSQVFEFKTDRTGWEYSLRVLHTMCLIEQDKFEEAETKLANLNRMLKKYDKTELSSRNKLIIEVLKFWLKGGGNKNIIQLKKNPALLKLNTPSNEWNPMGSELIPFHTWMKTKI